jgi:5S rRNA maturation endonuclease (ribonuclease M5)
VSEKRRVETLISLFERLGETSKEIAIIVEGRKDVIALRGLGVSGKIICLKNRNNTFFEIIEELANTQNSVIVLTDFDRYGSGLAKLLLRSLEEKKVKVNLVFWKQIKSLVRRDVKDVESLNKYTERLKSLHKL